MAARGAVRPWDRTVLLPNCRERRHRLHRRHARRMTWPGGWPRCTAPPAQSPSTVARWWWKEPCQPQRGQSSWICPASQCRRTGPAGWSACRTSRASQSRRSASSAAWSRASRAQPAAWPSSAWRGRPPGARSVTCCPQPGQGQVSGGGWCA